MDEYNNREIERYRSRVTLTLCGIHLNAPGLFENSNEIVEAGGIDIGHFDQTASIFF